MGPGVTEIEERFIEPLRSPKIGDQEQLIRAAKAHRIRGSLLSGGSRR